MLAACLFAALSLSTEVATGPKIEVHRLAPNSPAPVSGQFIDAAQSTLTILKSKQEKKLAFTDVSKIVLPDTQAIPASVPAFRVTLIDNSVIDCNSVRSTGETTLLGTPTTNIRCETKRISAIQIGSLTETETEAWNALCKLELTSDVLVLRRTGGKLERIEGIVLEMGSDSVEFDFSGQTITVPFPKLAGLRTFTTQTADPSPAQVVVIDASGATWPANTPAALAFDFDKASPSLQLTLPTGVKVDLPLDRIQRIEFDFLIGSTRYLTKLTGTFDQPPTPFGLGAQGKTQSGLGPTPIQYTPPDSRRIIPSILFRGGGTATYRIPSGFSRWSTDVLLAPSGQHTSKCRLVVLIDNREVWDATLSADAPESQIDLPLQPDQQLTIRVIPLSSVPVGASVLLRGARLIK